MKILLTHKPGGAYGFISEGWLNALKAAGHTVQRWDGIQSTWDEFNPDLYIGCSGHRQPIPKNHKHTKIAIHVNPYCDMSIDGINETADAINWTVNQKPTVVFGYGHEDYRSYWANWTTKHNIPWVPMPTAGDSTIFKDYGAFRDLDIVYVGGYWPYKARNIDKYLIPAIKTTNLKSRICGWGDWPVVASKIDDRDVPALFNIAKIGPCIVEPHTSKWGIDIPERMWKVALCGALVISDPVKDIEKHMPSVVVANDPKHYAELCEYYSANDNKQERLEIANQQKAEVIKNNTYFKRLAVLFRAIDKATDCSGDFEQESIKLETMW